MQAGLGRDITRYLQDGTILLKIIDIIQPGAVKKIEWSYHPYVQMDNIAQFIYYCEDIIGIPRRDNFLTGDLYTANNIKNVSI